LRSLLLAVTLVGIWLGWELRVVRERQRLWRQINDAGGYTLSDGIATVPTIRRWLGDTPRDIIAIPAERFSLSDAAHVEATFPESKVLRDPQELIWREGDEDQN